MEMPIEQARLIQQILIDFVTRLKALEIAVEKLSTGGEFDEAQPAARQMLATLDTYVEPPRVEYADISAMLTAIGKILQ